MPLPSPFDRYAAALAEVAPQIAEVRMNLARVAAELPLEVAAATYRQQLPRILHEQDGFDTTQVAYVMKQLPEDPADCLDMILDLSALLTVAAAYGHDRLFARTVPRRP